MSCKIFYSWQTDLPNATNRGFIQKALENATKSIRDDNSLQVEPVVDRDTTGVPGAPDIASTIFAKIEQAQVFVCDVSIINQGTHSRPTPNPNVLIELGYAMKTLGPQRIIMVMNSVFGKPELLPFDLRMRRVITYCMPERTEERAAERKKIEASFAEGLRIILTGLEEQTVGEIVQPLPISDRAILAVESSQPDRVSVVRKFMEWLLEEMDVLNPISSVGELDESLIGAIDRTKELVVEFSRLVETIAMMNDSNAAFAVYKGFERFLERYNPQRGFSGSF